MNETEQSTPLIVDAVIHAYNLAEENARNPIAASFAAASYGMVQLTGDHAMISMEQFCHDWSVDSLAELVFVESDVDLATFHAVPLGDYFYDGMVSNEKGIEMRRRWPDRVLFYGAVNPLEGAKALEDAEYLVKEGGASGIKLYPEWYVGGGVKPISLADEAIDPLLQKVQELGAVLAIHKAVPAGQGLTDNYRVGDVEAAAARYPELPIEVVHAGMAFLDETTYLLQRYPNVYANLEVTSAFAVHLKRRFAEALGALMFSGALDRIIFATGCCLVHPQPIIEALRSFTMPEDLTAGYGYPPVSEDVMRGILGENYLRLHGLDPEDVRRRIADDDFATRRAQGRPSRWSAVTSDAPV